MLVNFFQQGLNIITGPVFTRILSATDYGIIEYENDRNEFIYSMLILSNIATVLLFAIYCIFKKSIDDIIQLPTSPMVLMFCNLIFTPAYGFWTIRERFEYRYKLTGSIIVIPSILSSLIAIIAVLNTKTNKIEARLWGGALVTLPIALFFYLTIILKSKKLISIKYWKEALRFNLPLIPHYLSIYVF